VSVGTIVGIILVLKEGLADIDTLLDKEDEELVILDPPSNKSFNTLL
jgi:hypothetical protein